MKLTKDPLFIWVALLFFYPLGLFLLLRTKWKPIYKISLSIGGGLFIAIILAIILIPTKASAPSYLLSVTDDRLYLGQSASFSLTADQQHYTDYTVSAENDCLSLSGNVFTAERIGKCRLTVTYGNHTESILITIDSDTGKNQKVYASPSGEKYHKTKSHGGKNAVAMIKEDAEQSGKTPCKICYKQF